ncbi:SDR family NAD(P)-dependent oxidoreductase [Sphingomonas ginsenosidivorax]|uniref:SDR family NAD(P)-dependent oxidoreductase n=1 Tax=Sphingomonas ginsenosidivorax TaxID=862135 RepID=A0A5C6UDE6_9SPHN|nr:SDR family NAD(P)-dependent oxidoreductase [Sphingomonas ginsenosidivorax]TXC70241.1 SDR family NAD(P)-dependent oxidoreductase [Sphingomonas ginsenosidivorax]
MATQHVAVITGASSGIGKETAKALVARGWHVIALGRDPGRTASAETEIRAVAESGGRLDMLRADLALIANAEQAADAITTLTSRVDVLINNAGGMAAGKVITSEGLEANFAGNHLGPFVLTNRLLPLLRTAARDAAPGSVRIVNTASDGSEMIPGLHWDDLQLLDAFVPGRAYCQGKLANVMHARALAARLAHDGIVVHALHPGTVASNFINHADATTQAHIRTREHMSAKDGADALIWLATADESGRTTGDYYHQRKVMPPNPVALDDTQVERLWQESERLVATARA